MDTKLETANSDRELEGLLDELDAGVRGIAADDLGGLAALHSRFQRVREEVNLACPPAARGDASFAAARSEQLLEKLILGEVDDVSAALAQVVRSAGELRGIIGGVAAAAPMGPSVVPATPAAVEHLPTIEAEVALDPADAPLGLEFVSEAAGHLEAAESSLLKLEESHDVETVNAIFRSFHTIKGVAGFLNLKQIGAVAHAAENLLDLARKGQVDITGGNVDLVLETIDQLKNLLRAFEAALAARQPIAVQPALPSLVARLDAAASGAQPDQVSAARTTAAPVAAPVAAPAPTNTTAAVAAPAPGAPAAAADPPAAAPPPGDSRGSSTDATVKVATDRLDALINTVGELVIAQSMVSQDVLALAANSPRITRNVSHLSKIARELQDLSMSMRMVPVQGVFQKMARLSRDVARKSGKEIDFVMTGGETELDRNVVEAISDPLVHMVRNSIDHGVEPADQRVAAGKPRAGRVEIKAFHEAGNIVIQITDDGRGLNKKRLVEKATAAGILSPGQELSEQEVFKLIFHPGLSTAEKITDISGRGVGMDVVRKNVESLRGRIDITSVEGAGATFAIRLPLTLAVIDGLIVRIGTHRYIIPILSVEQSLRPTAGQISSVQNRGEMCVIRGRVLPLFRLYKLFKVTPASTDPTRALVVIVQDDDRRCCLMIDELVGQQQVVIKSLGDSVGAVRGISGGAILGDGSISLILDVPGLIELAVND